MVQGYTARVKDLLRQHGCELLRRGKGDHEIWRSPHAVKPITVDGKIMSRHSANGVLKDAGINVKL